MPRKILVLAVLAAAVFGLALGFVFVSHSPDDAFAECRGSAVATGGDGIGGPFTLVDRSGAEVTDNQVITKPSLVYFGYTFCPDVCPLDVTRNADAVDVLAERGQSVTPVFITIDPDRDTPEVLADYAENMHDRMIALTGSADQVKAASKAYKTYYKAQDKSDEFYLVDHSTFTYLVLPEYGFVEYFRRDLEADAMADQVGCFVENL